MRKHKDDHENNIILQVLSIIPDLSNIYDISHTFI